MGRFIDLFQIGSLILFLAILAAKVIYLRVKKGISPIAIGAGKRGWRRAFEIISFVGLGLWMIYVLLYSLRPELRLTPPPFDVRLIDPGFAKLLGVTLVTAGFAIFISAFISFGDSWRVGFDVKTPGQLVTTGIFAFTRNPIYLFFDLWFLGIFLLNGTLIFLLFALLAIASTHFQIIQEEEFLTATYGQAYRDYRARTGRYFTW